jgi:hypothetical protein
MSLTITIRKESKNQRIDIIASYSVRLSERALLAKQLIFEAILTSGRFEFNISKIKPSTRTVLTSFVFQMIQDNGSLFRLSRRFDTPIESFTPIFFGEPGDVETLHLCETASAISSTGKGCWLPTDSESSHFPHALAEYHQSSAEPNLPHHPLTPAFARASAGPLSSLATL